MDADAQLLILSLLPLAFVFCLGACVGSLTNVLVYRLPLGLDVVSPSSRCTHCQTKLTWRENIPILGWLLLGGKCRFCKSKISPEYPFVEALCAAMWGLVWVMCYLLIAWLGTSTGFGGMPFAKYSPDWAMSGWEQTWPIYLIVMLLFSSLLAMTIIDMRTFTIPMVLPIFATIVGILGHTLWAIVVQWQWGALRNTASTDLSAKLTSTYVWSIATPQIEFLGRGWWWWIGASIGAFLGMILANLALRMGWIQRSFADYDQWEAKVIADQQQADPLAQRSDDPTELWTAYPHARREMIREMAFLAPIVIGGIVGGLLMRLWAAEPVGGALSTGPDGSLSIQVGTPPPMWLLVLAGSLMGYLITAGVLWLIRIFGTLAFGKEALGLGDVHLMGAVGACLGWIDGVLAFFLAAPVALLLVLYLAVFQSKTKRTLPFGPSLSIATVLVFVFKPWIERAFTHLTGSEVPLNWP